MKYSRMKTIRYGHAAVEVPAALAPQVSERIIDKLHEFALTGGGDVKRWRDTARLRVGPWRVVCTETVDTIDVWAVGNRSTIYD